MLQYDHYVECMPQCRPLCFSRFGRFGQGAFANFTASDRSGLLGHYYYRTVMSKRKTQPDADIEAELVASDGLHKFDVYDGYKLYGSLRSSPHLLLHHNLDLHNHNHNLQLTVVLRFISEHSPTLLAFK